MILNFIENHRQKYFCTAHYIMLTISQKCFFVSLDELALFMEPDMK